MRPTLFHIPLADSGLMLGVWAIFSVATLLYQVRKHGLGREALAYVPLLLLIGAVVAFVLPVIADPQGLPIRGYGVMLLLGVVSGLALTLVRARRRGLDPEMINNLAFWLFLGGIVGARLFYIIEYRDQYHRDSIGQTLLAIVNLSQGGLVVYGSVFGGALALMLFVRKYKVPGLALTDLIAPAVLLGVALGRIGCFLNGCCYGGVCDLPWAVQFPWRSPPHVRQAELEMVYLHGLKLKAGPAGATLIDAVEPESEAERSGLKPGMRVEEINDARVTNVDEARLLLLETYGAGHRLSIIAGGDPRPRQWLLTGPDETSLPVHPAQLYSSLDGLLICLFLLAWDPFRRRDGESLAWAATIYPITRFLMEVIRTDEPAVLSTGLTISQNISLAILIGAGIFWVYLRRQPAHVAWPIHEQHPAVQPAT
ncbi:MAG TPA: prolipoprotein diacylglyceryl transferase family protein [Pirellulales bacterium]|jgi:phosphatidylglycerol:prolipoprotein diacylglycerol transferase|nr:prolipoprotein diacylglyceryl transferase family protein [Pirellulales bacterium]